MNVISLRVSKNTLTILNTAPITTKNSKYLYAQFSFDMDWVNMQKTAIFYQKPNNVKQVLLTNNGCLIPWEALELVGNLYIGIYGTQGTSRITTNVVSIMCQEGSFRKGTPPREPSPDIYEQILAQLTEMDEKIATTVGAPGYTPQKGIDYFDGYTPQKGIDYFDGADYVTPPPENGNIIRTDGVISAIEFETSTITINRIDGIISSISNSDGTSKTFIRQDGKIIGWEVS